MRFARSVEGAMIHISHISDISQRREFGFGFNMCGGDIPIISRAPPLHAEWSRPIMPQAFRIVCLNHMISSLDPEPVYSGRESSSALRESS